MAEDDAEKLIKKLKDNIAKADNDQERKARKEVYEIYQKLFNQIKSITS